MSEPKFSPMPTYLGPLDPAAKSPALEGKVTVVTTTLGPLVDWKTRAETAEARVAVLERENAKGFV